MRRHLCLNVFLLIVALAAGGTSAAADGPDDKLLQAYEEQLRRLLPDEHPENHRALTAWCREHHWEAEAAFHDQEADRHLASLEFEKRRALVKEGDADALKDLLAWAGTRLPPDDATLQAAAEQLLKLDPDCIEAHKRLRQPARRRDLDGCLGAPGQARRPAGRRGAIPGPPAAHGVLPGAGAALHAGADCRSRKGRPGEGHHRSYLEEGGMSQGPGGGFLAGVVSPSGRPG